jgi:hypothetical protein
VAEVLEEHRIARRRRWRDRFLTVRGLVSYADHVEVVVAYRYREDELARFIAAVERGDDAGHQPELPTPDITLTDDVGTRYTRVRSTKSGGQRVVLTVSFTPAVPAAAVTIVVCVDGQPLGEVPRTPVAQDV